MSELSFTNRDPQVCFLWANTGSITAITSSKVKTEDMKVSHYIIIIEGHGRMGWLVSKVDVYCSMASVSQQVAACDPTMCGM